MKNNINIDDYFKEQLENYSETPPSISWNQIQNNLGGGKMGLKFLATKWLNYIFITTIAAGITGVVIKKLFFQNSSNNIKSIQSSVIATNEKQNTIAENNQGTSIKNTISIKTISKDNTNQSTYKINTKDNINSIQNSNLNLTGNEAILVKNNIGKNDNKNNSPSKRSAVVKNSGVNKSKLYGKSSPLKPEAEKTVTKIVELLPQDVKVNSIIGYAKNDNDKVENSSNNNNANIEPLQIKTFKDDTILKHENKLFEEKPSSLNKPKTITPLFSKFNYGIKIGYELGFDRNSSSNYIVSPYLQYNISKTLSFYIQPGLKYNNIDTRNLQGSQSFYKINNDGKSRLTDSIAIIVITDTILDIFYKKVYSYTQTHDSVVKLYSVGGKYLSFELPLMAKFKLFKSLSVMGGININFNTLINVNENTKEYYNIDRTGTAKVFGTYNVVAPPIETIIKYESVPLSEYKGPLFVAPHGTIISYGYMFGLSYDFRDKYIIDIIAQRNNLKQNIVGGYDLNSPYSSLYWRVLVGYKIR